YHYMSSTMSLLITETPTPEIYHLSLHDALPIYRIRRQGEQQEVQGEDHRRAADVAGQRSEERAEECAGRHRHTRAFFGTFFRSLDRKSTRLNSSHVSISYAVFCLKKKKKHNNQT